MYQNSTVAAVIAASGTGTRMKSEVPKQFLNISGKPCLRRTTEIFVKMDVFDEIVVTAPLEYIDETKDVLSGLPVKVIAGGAKRGDSVLNALNETESEYVLIHDGVRPFVTEDVILRVITGTIKEGACLPAVRPKDTIRTADKTLKRDELYSVQTPQGFKTEMLKEAYLKALEDGFSGTDDASVAEHYGNDIFITEGDYENIKITTPEDLPVEMRIGKGIDVHKLVEGRPLILGGVEIPFEKGLLGHSDADVLTHAVMDALLGAADAGDIGKLFPDTDPAYEGANSIELLKKVGEVIGEKGYRIENIDAVVICERPKISPHIPAMKKALSDALGITEDKISIKGTTTEKLGFTGRGEGIASEAVCILQR